MKSINPLGCCIAALFLIMSLQAHAQQRMYRVVMNDGTVYESPNIKLRAYDGDDTEGFAVVTNGSRLIINDTLKVKVSDVKMFDVEAGSYLRLFVEGKGSQLYRREVEGSRISLYSRAGAMTSTYGTRTQYKKFWYIKDNGQLKKIKVSNLMDDLGDDPMAYAEMRKAKSNQTMSVVSIVAGLGIIVGSMASLASKPNTPSTVPPPGQTTSSSSGEFTGVVLGLGVTLTTWIFQSAKYKHMGLAIDAYNKK